MESVTMDEMVKMIFDRYNFAARPFTTSEVTLEVMRALRTPFKREEHQTKLGRIVITPEELVDAFELQVEEAVVEMLDPLFYRDGEYWLPR